MLCPDTVSRRGATDAGDGSAVLPGAYVLPRGVSPLAGCPSLATGWSFSIGNLLNLNIIPCVEPRPCCATVHNRVPTEYLDGIVTFKFVDTIDTYFQNNMAKLKFGEDITVPIDISSAWHPVDSYQSCW